jgi:hypothetical protein
VWIPRLSLPLHLLGPMYLRFLRDEAVQEEVEGEIEVGIDGCLQSWREDGGEGVH